MHFEQGTHNNRMLKTRWDICGRMVQVRGSRRDSGIGSPLCFRMRTKVSCQGSLHLLDDYSMLIHFMFVRAMRNLVTAKTNNDYRNANGSNWQTPSAKCSGAFVETR